MSGPMVIFSDKAYIGILAETYEKVDTETGGIFLGKKVNDIWYVLETIDPGPNSIFQAAYFEYDTPYVNHLANKIARFYKNRIELIGLWHRHPGNFSRFSSTDDGTNEKYARQRGNSAISALVNLIPNFQLTVYQVELPLKYINIRFIVGDKHIPQDLLTIKRISDFGRQQSTQITSINSIPRSQKDSSILKALLGGPGKILSGVFQPKSSPVLISGSNPLPEHLEPMASINAEVIDMIDSEIEYLTNQTEYEFSMKPLGERVSVSMSSRHNQLNFTFGYSRDRGYVLVGNGKDSHEYAPNFIRDYINTLDSAI